MIDGTKAARLRYDGRRRAAFVFIFWGLMNTRPTESLLEIPLLCSLLCVKASPSGGGAERMRGGEGHVVTRFTILSKE